VASFTESLPQVPLRCRLTVRLREHAGALVAGAGLTVAQAASMAGTLVADPTRINAAVEEILRAPRLGGGGIPRYARTDLEVDGVHVRAGELVLLDTGAANHDAATFPDPDRFDIAREAAGHLTFGHGSRYCIGAPLARIELQVAFSQIAARFPTLRLDVPVHELRFNPHVLTGGLTALPVAW
jgi:pentalenolactone synthase